MDFILYAGTGLLIMFCIVLTLDAIAFWCGRLWPRWRYWWQQRRLCGPSGKPSLERRKSSSTVPLGQLKFTRTRAESLRNEGD
jgi:hypothetical protein